VDGCKVRVVGTGGSPDGLVKQKQEGKVVVVNLNDMQTRSRWNGVLDKTKKRVRMGAGKTFLDLMAVIRPQGYILKSRTLGKYFTLGGMYLTPGNHGASLAADTLPKYATAFRALLSNGQYVDITNPKDVAVWRGSLGLLGIVVAIEIEVEEDKGMLHQYQERVFRDDFTPEAVIPFLKQTMANMDAVHWFYNFWSDKIFALQVNNSGDPTFNYTNTAGIYAQQQAQFPTLGKTGVIPLDIQALAGGLNISFDQVGPYVAGMAENLLKESWLAQNFLARDGYLHETGTIVQFNNVETLVKCHTNCVDDGTIFALIAGSRQLVQASLYYMNRLKPWMPSLLFTFRIIKVESGGMLLENKAPGYYVGFETEDAKGLFPGGGHRAVFQRLERLWRRIRPNPTAHIGKEYGYSKLASLDDPYAFQDRAFVRGLYSNKIKADFRAAMKKWDPKGLFRAGAGAHHVGASGMRFDPRSKNGEQCESTGFCLTGCCCTFPITCQTAGVLNTCVPCDSPAL